jgi:plasmid maintenance system antidote protein VapI
MTTELARRLGASPLTVSELLLEKRGLCPEIAVRIGRLLAAIQPIKAAA